MMAIEPGLTLSCSFVVTCADAQEPVGRSTQFIEVNGSRLHVEREGSGPPLLFLHGGLQFFANDPEYLWVRSLQNLLVAGSTQKTANECAVRGRAIRKLIVNERSS